MTKMQKFMIIKSLKSRNYVESFMYLSDFFPHYFIRNCEYERKYHTQLFFFFIRQQKASIVTFNNKHTLLQALFNNTSGIVKSFIGIR